MPMEGAYQLCQELEKRYVKYMISIEREDALMLSAICSGEKPAVIKGWTMGVKSALLNLTTWVFPSGRAFAITWVCLGR